MATKRQVSTAAFLQTHPVFTLKTAMMALTPPGGKKGTLDRLYYHRSSGRLLPVFRGVYASVPPNVPPDRFQPDAFLVAVAVRPDAIFAYHSALELLGVAQSVWNVQSVFTARRRPSVRLGRQRLDFLAAPAILAHSGKTALGVRDVDRAGQRLKVTGPERTLVDGLHSPGRVGGVAELVASAASFSSLDLGLLRHVLDAYAEKALYASVGWFLERHKKSFVVPDEFLAALEARTPKSPQYLVRGHRGGQFVRRWNLVLPHTAGGEPDEY